MNWSGKAAVVGVNESPRRKAPGVHPYVIGSECAHAALDDAGLTFADVDGFATCAGYAPEGGGYMDVAEVAEYLGIAPRWMDSTDIGGGAFISHAAHAAAAINEGMADVVLIVYGSSGRSWPMPGPDANTNQAGPGQWELPYGPTTIAGYALAAQRHMHDYGTTPEQLAKISVQCRQNAARNPDARFCDPLSVEKVLASPIIASPLHRNDCCVVTDSGGALVVTSAERAKDCAKEPVYLLGFGEATEWVQMNQMWPLTETSARLSGPAAFDMAGMGHDQVDCAQLYDSFTITVLITLESLGFCGKGEGGTFVDSGALAPGGSLPINTDGGGLSSNHSGRRGMYSMIEAVRQLRGESPGIQLDDPKAALVHGTGGWLSACSTMIMGV